MPFAVSDIAFSPIESLSPVVPLEYVHDQGEVLGGSPTVTSVDVNWTVRVIPDTGAFVGFCTRNCTLLLPPCGIQKGLGVITT